MVKSKLLPCNTIQQPSIDKFKTPRCCGREYLTVWVNTFGVPNKILTDNGKQFNNEELHDIMEKLNMKVLETAAESLWSNIICQRHNAVTGHMTDKIKDESDVLTEVALAWAINSMNGLHEVHGFSPSQLVFGRNFNLPSVLNDKLPAVAGHTSSAVVANQLQRKYDELCFIIYNSQQL